MVNNVLVMDPSNGQKTEVVQKLIQSGYEVDPAPDSISAIDYAMDMHYDFILLDLEQMETSNPKRLLHRLHSLLPQSKIILLVRDGWNREQAELIREADGILFKIALPNRLRDTLEAMRKAG